MIKLKIISCPNENLIGEYEFFYPKLRFGRKKSHVHFYVNDQAMSSSILCLSEQPDGVLIWEESGGFYFSNSKKISGKKLHRVGDTFGLGNTSVEIIQVIPTLVSFDHETRYHELTEKFPYMADLFWAFKQEILAIEKEKKVE